MDEDGDIPRIESCFESELGRFNSQLYCDVIHNTVAQIIPDGIFSGEYEQQHRNFNSLLPHMTYTPIKEVPCKISFLSIFRYRMNGFKFFFDMLSRWLVPGKRLDVVVMYAADFKMPDLGNEVYTVCEVMIQINSKADLEEIQRNLPIIETEIRLGVVSRFYAERILEIKGLSNDEKTAFIQEHIASLVRRIPKDFDFDVFTEMQHVLVMCTDEFKEARSIRHLSRLISYQYLFRKNLREEVKKAPEKRHVSVKLFRTTVHEREDEKRALGIVVGVNFVKDREVFAERHLIKAIRKFVPHIHPVKHSFFSNRRGYESIVTVYLEVEKENGEEFSASEILTLRNDLPGELKTRIEQLTHPVFMPRNEEEVMRNILSLSSQIRYVKDLPQVFITFDEQSDREIYFTVIVVRVLQGKRETIREKFKKSDTTLKYIHDRNKVVGYLRKKHKKEATVFRVKLLKEQFQRSDHSIDMYKARQQVVNELTKVIGDFRDYNGGMIAKQNELLTKVRKLLAPTVKYDDLLLENFFYSLNPVMMRTVLEPEALQQLFQMLLNSIEAGFYNEEKYSMKIRSESEFVFVMIATDDPKLEEMMNSSLSDMELGPASLATSFVEVYDARYLGYIYRCDDSEKQMKFCETMQITINEWGAQRFAGAREGA